VVAQLLHAMFKIALMTLPLPQYQCWQSLTAAQGMGPIVLLRVHNAQALNRTRDGAPTQGGRTRRLPSLPRHARGVLAKYAAINGIGFTSLAERFCETTGTTRVDDTDLHLPMSMQC